MRIAFVPAKFPHETAFLEALEETCRGLGHTTLPLDGRLREYNLLIKWGGDYNPVGDGRTFVRAPTLYVELGWLPRWSYQVSWGGVNAKHHAAGRGSSITSGQENAVFAELHSIRSGSGMPKRGWFYCDPTVPAYESMMPFYLCPLQVPGDINMGALSEEMRTPQGMIDYILTGVSPGPISGPIYFKQHPATSEHGQRIDIPPPHRYLAHYAGQIASYLKSPQCLGVICGNSNVFHDALLWGKTATALGDGFWGKGPVTMKPGTDETLAYIRHILANQWTVAMAKDPARVAVLIGDALA